MKKVFIAALLFTIIGLSSCINDFLTIAPQSDLVQGTFWKSEGDLIIALNGTYSLMQKTLSANSGMSYLTWYVVRGDDFIGGNSTNSVQELDVSFNKIASGHATTDWNDWYKVINATNYALYYIPKMTSVGQSTKNKYISEALFMRAYCYFNLARIWGDVPLILNPTLVPEDAIKPFRNTQAKVMQQVVSDLDSALVKADKTVANINIVRGNIGAIYALYTQVCMWNHTDADYAKAITMSQALIDLKKFNLEPVATYGKIFATGTTQENIWTLQWSYAANGYNVAAAMMCKSVDISLGMAKGFRTLWTDPQYVGDGRRKQSIDTIDNTVSKYTIDYVTKKMPNCTLRKWVDSPTPNTFLTNTNEVPLILLRLADIILLKAEAHNKLSQFNLALVELNKIRTRANIPVKVLADYGSDPTTIMNAIENDILQERRFELMGEPNCRVFDLMRTGKLKETMNNFYDNEILLNAPTVTVNKFDGNVWYLPIFESNAIENQNLLSPPIE